MTRTQRRYGVDIAVAVAALLATGLGGTARAQEVASLDAVAERVKLGATIRVTSTDGRNAVGTLTKLSSSTLRIKSGGATTDFRADEIRAIHRRKPKPYGRDVAIGLGIGAGLGAIAIAADRCEGIPCGTALDLMVVGFLGGVGAGVGALVAGSTPEKSILVYELKTASSSVRLGVSPIATPARQGVILTFRF